jgi:hypothetical protein
MVASNVYTGIKHPPKNHQPWLEKSSNSMVGSSEFYRGDSLRTGLQ